MSNRNNDVFRVLPITSTTLLPTTAGNSVETLAVGQLGIFDAATNAAVNASTSPLPKEFFFAVGVDKNGDSVVDDYRFSAGQKIQKGNIVGYTEKAYNAGAPMIVTVGNYKTQCETEYGIRVEFRNSRISRIQGFNQFSKAYMVTTPCCDDCAEGCGSADANNLTLLLVNAVNIDDANLLVAQAVARQAVTTATHGTSVNYATGAVMTAADVQALITFNLTAVAADQVFTDVKLTSVPLSIGTYCQVNLGYHKLLETVLIVSLIEGFSCSGATTVNQYPTYAEGTGANIQQKEYHASGWNGSGPYKLSQVTGTAKGNIEYLAVKSTNYDQVILEHNMSSESGWKEYNNTLSTIFAFPTGTNAAKTALKAFLDLYK